MKRSSCQSYFGSFSRSLNLQRSEYHAKADSGADPFSAGVLVLGPRVIPVLRKLKFGQTVYELGPQSHKTKQGTPTMGGLMFVLTTCLAAAVFTGNWYGKWDFTLALIGVSLLTMLVGFGGRLHQGREKAQSGPDLVAEGRGAGGDLAGLLLVLLSQSHGGSSVIVPFFNVEWDLACSMCR